MVYAKNNRLRGSVQKVGLVAALIRGEKVDRAIVSLTYSKRRVAHDIKKVLFSAMANAQANANLDVDNLYVSEVIVGKSKSLKRMMPRARGRGNRITKHYSNIKIILKEVE